MRIDKIVVINFKNPSEKTVNRSLKQLNETPEKGKI